MKWSVDIPVEPIKPPAEYGDKMLLAGSCFSENIGDFLTQYKFDPVINPHGIVYNPASIAQSLEACLDNKKYTEKDLFSHHGLWHSWDHHERFSAPDAAAVLDAIHHETERTSQCLREADWLILTFGSAGIYKLKTENRIVANCHKLPATAFDFSLMTPAEVVSVLDHFIHKFFAINKKARIIFTVSPVRYIRRGLVESNLSKSILLYAVHHLVKKFDRLIYFPAYEIVIDELRDYRFYKEDLVHPNGQAVRYVWEKFAHSFFSENALRVMEEIKPVLQAAAHRPFHTNTAEYNKFKMAQLERIESLQEKYPFLDFTNEKKIFG